MTFNKILHEHQAFLEPDFFGVDILSGFVSLPNMPMVRTRPLQASQYTEGSTDPNYKSKLPEPYLLKFPSRLIRRYVPLSVEVAPRGSAGTTLLPTEASVRPESVINTVYTKENNFKENVQVIKNEGSQSALVIASKINLNSPKTSTKIDGAKQSPTKPLSTLPRAENKKTQIINKTEEIVYLDENASNAEKANISENNELQNENTAVMFEKEVINKPQEAYAVENIEQVKNSEKVDLGSEVHLTDVANLTMCQNVSSEISIGSQTQAVSDFQLNQWGINEYTPSSERHVLIQQKTPGSIFDLKPFDSVLPSKPTQRTENLNTSAESALPRQERQEDLSAKQKINEKLDKQQSQVKTNLTLENEFHLQKINRKTTIKNSVADIDNLIEDWSISTAAHDSNNDLLSLDTSESSAKSDLGFEDIELAESQVQTLKGNDQASAFLGTTKSLNKISKDNPEKMELLRSTPPSAQNLFDPLKINSSDNDDNELHQQEVIQTSNETSPTSDPTLYTNINDLNANFIIEDSTNHVTGLGKHNTENHKTITLQENNSSDLLVSRSLSESNKTEHVEELAFDIFANQKQEYIAVDIPEVSEEAVSHSANNTVSANDFEEIVFNKKVKVFKPKKRQNKTVDAESVDNTQNFTRQNNKASNNVSNAQEFMSDDPEFVQEILIHDNYVLPTNKLNLSKPLFVKDIQKQKLDDNLDENLLGHQNTSNMTAKDRQAALSYAQQKITNIIREELKTVYSSEIEQLHSAGRNADNERATIITETVEKLQTIFDIPIQDLKLEQDLIKQNLDSQFEKSLKLALEKAQHEWRIMTKKMLVDLLQEIMRS